jgi:hypothetical protein
VTKILRRTKTKRAARAAIPLPRRTVTRREYAELVVRLVATEAQTQRQRAALAVQEQRITQLQEEMDALKKATVAQAIANDIALVPLPATPTIES